MEPARREEGEQRRQPSLLGARQPRHEPLEERVRDALGSRAGRERVRDRVERPELQRAARHRNPVSR